MINIEDSKKPLTDREILALEKKLDISLPTEYQEFLLRYNGGQPVHHKDGEEQLYRFVFGDDDYSDSEIDRFLAVYEGEYSNFEDYFIIYKSEERIPLNLVPIAHDPGGNLICISVSGADLGSIYFWDHEYEMDGPKKSVSFIAKSFNEFLALLQ